MTMQRISVALFVIVAALCTAGVTYAAEDATVQRLYDAVVRGLSPPLDERRCGKVLQDVLRGALRNTAESLIEARIRFTQLRMRNCVNDKFNIRINPPKCGDSHTPPIRIRELAGKRMLLGADSFSWRDSRCPGYADSLDRIAEAVESGVSEFEFRMKENILDVRNNRGGDLYALIAFLEATYSPARGSTVAVEINNRSATIRYLTRKAGLLSCPTAILVNKWTASAAEIAVGAIQSWCPNTVVVGERTYGKGTFSTAKFVGALVVSFTTAEWRVLSPNGALRKVDGIGITPDVIVSSRALRASFEERFGAPSASRPPDRLLDIVVEAMKIIEHSDDEPERALQMKMEI